MADLSESVTGNFINATRFFGHVPLLTPVIFYVEGDDDIHLWTDTLSKYGNKYDITITTNKAKNNESNGKNNLVSMHELCQNKMVAVDADFDLIVDNYSTHTQQIRTEKYIINTEYYSIENILAQPEPVSEVVSLIKNGCCMTLSYEEFLGKFSTVIYDIFIYLLSCLEQKNKKFEASHFGKLLNELHIHNNNYVHDLDEFYTFYHDKFQKEFDLNKIQMEKFNQRLHEKGYSPEDTYKLIKGHHLWNIVISKLLEFECTEYRKAECKRLNMTLSDFNKELGEYCSIAKCIKDKIYNNTPIGSWMPQKVVDKLDTLFP